ncbi:MAG: Holliday junction branch migration protein RuvA [Peptostreptococcus porci]|uniref:Holliday junction branch migration complex subunit RuvA n=1 Tax=Peptostreptococcus porci TaxID=2652282 RepID=A0A6N7WY20_9FIRM|nr:Holliday junction branch migration protein RuvA [Peptostreptococcus porci]MDD7183480.1 Holliday junction branch migration protein RuvA [Peptostreptococcus porci]MDY2795166.1 Holliday junction branch migration protein RuvA [Peptostreptococcus porci]MDY4127427.1 Holliday junction branch migration protein RuvA [Peptostreptococcus porci]MDY5479417.1 Holliday junction branch migration protein RuvA [Peptostreptococcus porci]MDY5964492.1 Holliday junction branch migration protein RuvA [Peptostrept
MIAYIKGTIEEIGIDSLVIENNGMGYKLLVSTNTVSRVAIGEKHKIYSKMIVREDDISLCGFYSKEELEMFELLTSVSKIGTKVGLGILSFASPNVINGYILNADIAALSKAPGVGKKTAERMVLELKDKVSKLVVDEADSIEITDSRIGDVVASEAIEALIGLGYTRIESESAVNFVKQPGMSVEDVIRKGLEYIMKTGIKF